MRGEFKIMGINVTIQHKDHNHEVNFVKNHDTGKYEVWVDKKLIRLAGIFTILNAKKILEKHLKG